MKLSKWMALHKRGDAWLAAQVGRERSFITKVRNGKAAPSVEVAARIQRVTNGGVTALDLADSIEEGADASATDQEATA